VRRADRGADRAAGAGDADQRVSFSERQSRCIRRHAGVGGRTKGEPTSVAPGIDEGKKSDP
jgi:hypothetical protein